MALVTPLRQTHAQALTFSQQSAQFIRGTSAFTYLGGFPLALFPAESIEHWAEHERLFISCLRTGDDESAFIYLEKLIQRFGATNEKIMAFRGLYQEAVAENEPALRKILLDYDDILAKDPINVPIAKRRIALLRLLSRPSDAVDGLTELLEASPTDVEAWSELADLYSSLSLFSQAIFCLEEILLVTPNAWNVHARLGDTKFLMAKASGDERESLIASMQRYCRSIELCDRYSHGYCGLKLTTDRLLNMPHSSGLGQSLNVRDGIDVSIQTIRDLNTLAASELAKMIRLGVKAGYNEADILAAKAVLGQRQDT